jgi:hypothetical protein
MGAKSAIMKTGRITQSEAIDVQIQHCDIMIALRIVDFKSSEPNYAT